MKARRKQARPLTFGERLSDREASQRVIAEGEREVRRKLSRQPVTTNLGEKLRAALEGEVST